MSFDSAALAALGGPEVDIVNEFFDRLVADETIGPCFRNIRLVESWAALWTFEDSALMVTCIPTADGGLPSLTDDIPVEITIGIHRTADDLVTRSTLRGLAFKNALRRFVKANGVLVRSSDQVKMTYDAAALDWVAQKVNGNVRQQSFAFRARYLSTINPLTGTFK